jgi:signal transduction histidine kinase
VSSFLIAGAYFMIPASLLKFMRVRQDIPFTRIFWLFILFILACGTTHLLDGIIFWYPMYRFSAVLLFITACISWFAFFALRRVLPEALELKSPQQLERIINRRTAQLRETNITLKRINEDLDTYVYAASHDLKSPINNMEGLLAVIRDDINAGHMPSEMIVARLEESVERVQNTISRFTDVVKLQRSPYDDVLENNTEEVFNQVIEDIRHLVDKNDAKITFNSELKYLRYSASGLKSIMYNLIANAVKYRHPERECIVEVRFYSKKGNHFLEVKDNGVGIDLERFG